MQGKKKPSRFARKPSQDTIEHPTPSKTEDFDDYMAPLDNFATFEQKKRLDNEFPKKNVSIKQLMEEEREKGMENPISSSNKGFQLLKKFGYSEGGLGKDGKGQTEPVQMLKRKARDNSGIGIYEREEKRKKLRKVAQEQLNLLKERRATEFVRFKSTSLKETKDSKDKKKAQKVIYELDERIGIPVHKLTKNYQEKEQALHFGQQDGDEQSINNKESEESETAEDEFSLLECLLYLRDTHNYCFYCGVQYEDEVDLIESCPGLFDDDH